MCMLGMRSYFFHKLLDHVTADTWCWALSSACEDQSSSSSAGLLTISFQHPVLVLAAFRGTGASKKREVLRG